MQRYLYNLATDRDNSLIAGIIKLFLFPFSLVYGLIIRFLIFIYRQNPYRLSCKVISVGNITLGGTGKTPLVEYIAGFLTENGRKVAILTRGYKRKFTRLRARGPDLETMGDEPYMLQLKLKDIPVIVDADRISAARRAVCDLGADTVILDDGFQQWKIKKDLEIVAIDSTCAFGNRHMLPRGILREPLSSLKRADIFVLTKVDFNPDIQKIKDFLNEIHPKALTFESSHRASGFYKLQPCPCAREKDGLSDISVLTGKSAALVSGIADPGSFRKLVVSLGINIGLNFEFPDHYQYSREELENIIQESENKKVDMVITTEKDAARLSPLTMSNCSLPIVVLCIQLKITQDEEGFRNRLLKLSPL